MNAQARLVDDEVRKGLEGLGGWRLAAGAIAREFRFASFVEAFGFLARVALVAESLRHHPELTSSYDRVTVRLTTHDAGGVTRLDLDLAARIDQLGDR
ncbi:MAG: 4a-hydroxytetrahydrobiopterin dehydratase [Planctomycetes bacterium]|nr:4a-hydroxytetrahydrobiopterin dehydratase [Planctomycetota bacterium]